MLRRLAKGLFMEARILAVLVWSTTAVTLGTALAARPHDFGLYAAAILAGLLGQGYTTHAINEIRDWTSGTDQHGLGGSKVVREGLLTIPELWGVFWASLLLVLWLARWCAARSGPGAWGFMIAALLAGICYSLPPIQLAYRPYLGEWLGAAPGIICCVCGAYYVQTLSVHLAVGLLAVGFALQCMAIMTMFHTMDFDADRQAVPCKRTTVVHLGPAAAQDYVFRLQAGAMACYLGLAVWQGWRLIPLLVQGLVCWQAFTAYEPTQTRSIMASSRTVTVATIVGGLATAIALEPAFVFMIPVLAAAWLSHKRFGRLPRLS